jgi:small subunit ribosomal protein S6
MSSYWLMHFDANPSTLNELSEKLRVDQRVIRHTMIKLGDTLPTIIDRPDKTHMI